MTKKGLCWIRRDLRLHDHHALSVATKECDEVYIIFVFDTCIIEKLPTTQDSRLSFIHQSLEEIDQKLEHKLIIKLGDPQKIIPSVFKQLDCQTLYFNRDYEPYAKKRDDSVKNLIEGGGGEVKSYKDHVRFESHEVLTLKDEPYQVFTPYKRRWLECFSTEVHSLNDFKTQLKKISHPGKEHLSAIDRWPQKIGFQNRPPSLTGGTMSGKKKLRQFEKIISAYQEKRDFPSQEGTSQLSVYIRHGNLSIRDLLRLALKGKTQGHQTWLSELIWREFYQAILDRFPHVTRSAFKPQYDQIKWIGKPSHFTKWCEGQTGFPIIDAAMRELSQTGQMHNRLRMVVASFLCKTLLIDWKKGEQYFAEKLLDFDLAANNGGWQWSSSTGCDAQPYFRIFNPYSQSMKFDPEGVYIKKFVPELKSLTPKEIHNPPKLKHYPAPIVDYKVQRDRALKMYKAIKE